MSPLGQYALWLMLATVSSASEHVDPTRTNSSCQDILKFAFPDLCPLEVTKGSLRIRGLELAYWRYHAPGISPRRDPVLTVHGGPAFAHNYLLPLQQLACRGHDVVFYDQVGCGESSVPEDPRHEAPWLFTIDYYFEEVRALVANFNWQSFHLLGHSWGTIVSQAFALQQDPRLRAVVLVGPLADAQLYIRSQWDKKVGSLGSLPSYTQHVIKELEKAEAYDSPLYGALDSVLTDFFTVRTLPTPDCFQKSAGGMANAGTKQIYVGVQGASEFTLAGVLTNLNLTGQLPSVHNPVLLVRGEFDTMRPPTVDAIYESLPLAFRAAIPHAAHCSHIDEPRLVNDIAAEFLRRAEGGAFGDLQSWIDAATGQPLAVETPAINRRLSFGYAASHPSSSCLLPALQAVMLLTLGAAGGFYLGPHVAPSVRRLTGGKAAPLLQAA